MSEAPQDPKFADAQKGDESSDAADGADQAETGGGVEKKDAKINPATETTAPAPEPPGPSPAANIEGFFASIRQQAAVDDPEAVVPNPIAMDLQRNVLASTQRGQVHTIDTDSTVLENGELHLTEGSVLRIAGKDVVVRNLIVQGPGAATDGFRSGLIEVVGKAQVQLIDVTVKGSKHSCGVVVRDHAALKLKGCCFIENGGAGLAILGAHASVTAIESQLSCNHGPGADVCWGAKAVFADCIFAGSTSQHGLQAWGTNTEVEVSGGSSIKNQCGAFVYASAKMTLRGVLLQNNMLHGAAALQPGSQINLAECQVLGNAQSGIDARLGATITLDKTKVAEQASCGVLAMDDGSSITLTGGSVSGNAGSGVWAHNGGKVHLAADASVTHNKSCGARATATGAISGQAASVSNNAKANVLVHDGGLATFEECMINGAQSVAGVLSHGEGKIEIRGGEARENKPFGMHAIYGGTIKLSGVKVVQSEQANLVAGKLEESPGAAGGTITCTAECQILPPEAVMQQEGGVIEGLA